MEQKELMIGDWVRCKSDMVQIKTHWDIYNAEDFEPIPITLEILEKNGFKIHKLENVTFCNSKEVNINICDESIWCHIDILGISISHYGIRYVHELQHALRLCKIDKEIKL